MQECFKANAALFWTPAGRVALVEGPLHSASVVLKFSRKEGILLNSHGIYSLILPWSLHFAVQHLCSLYSTKLVCSFLFPLHLPHRGLCSQAHVSCSAAWDESESRTAALLAH